MAGGGHGDDASGTPDPVEKGFATLNTIRCDIFSLYATIQGFVISC